MPPKRGFLDADPVKQKVLVLPTGSLYGLRSGSAEHAALQSFVENGGACRPASCHRRERLRGAKQRYTQDPAGFRSVVALLSSDRGVGPANGCVGRRLHAGRARRRCGRHKPGLPWDVRFKKIVPRPFSWPTSAGRSSGGTISRRPSPHTALVNATLKTRRGRSSWTSTGTERRTFFSEVRTRSSP